MHCINLRFSSVATRPFPSELGWRSLLRRRLTSSTSVATRQRLKASFHLYARCSVGWSASRVYGTLRSTGLLAGYIIPCYDVLHTFSKEYMVEHPDVQHSRPNLDFGGASLPW